MLKLPVRCLLAAALALLPRPAHAAADAVTDSLTRYLDGLDAFGFAGQVVATDGSGMRFERALGTADARGARVTPHTGFAAGSVTKSITAAIVLRLAHEGRLSLDAALESLLPDVPPDMAPITPRQLLSHTSGLPEDAEGVFELDRREKVLKATLASNLVSPPGERFVYSNAGFQLLAAIAEQATGRPWPRLADSLVLAPLGMRESGAGSAYGAAREEPACGRNEWRWLGTFHDWRQPWAGSGAGDLVTTAADLARWGVALQNGPPWGAALADSQTTRRARASAQAFYGDGLWLLPREGRSDVVLVGGDIPGYHAGLWFERDGERRLVSVTSAVEQWGRRLPVAVVQRAVWRMLDHEPVELPPATVQWPQERLKALAGEYRLAPAGRMRLVAEGDRLRLELSGAEAMALLEGPDSSGIREFVESRAADLVRAAAASEDSALAQVLLPVERGWMRALRELVTAHVRAHGAITGATIDGTVRLPWLADGLRTYVTLESKRGRTRLSLAWLQKGLLDVSPDDGRPAPVVLPVAPLADGGLGAWDMVRGTLVTLQPFRDAKGRGLQLLGNGARFVGR